MSNPLNQPVPVYDPRTFNTEPHARIIQKPWGYELHWVPEGAPYLGKVLHINQGARLSLQLHDEKSGSWLLINGEAKVIWDNESGELTETILRRDAGLSTQIGQRHRLVAITECDIEEVSTPEAGTTWRLEDDYARPNQTPDERQAEYLAQAQQD